MNRAEQLTTELCERTFLSLWSYPNPQGKGGKELCDVLAVCGTDVVIFSVKEVGLSDAGDPVQIERWQRRAVEESTKQILRRRALA